MRSGAIATAVFLSAFAMGGMGASAQVPDLPPINEGPVSGSPQDRLYPGETGTGVQEQQPAPAEAAPVQPDAFPAASATLPPVQAAPAGPPLDVDRVMDHVKTCWTRIPQTNGTPAQGGIARIRLKLQSNGMLDGSPMIIDKPLGPVGTKFAESAAEAIQKCQPYRLPPDRYAEWRLIEMRFDTIDPDNPPPPPPPPAPEAVAPAAPAEQPMGLPPANDGYVPSVPAPGEIR